MLEKLQQDLAQKGWHRLSASEELNAWSEVHLSAAQNCMGDKQHKQWWRYQNTWFAGVNALPNDDKGAVGDKPPLPQSLRQLLADYCQTSIQAMDQGQISALFPGYPQPDPQQSKAANHFRKHHFAAHLDGLVPHGPDRRRLLTEQHSFILGISLTDHPANAAPLMVWPGSHMILQKWLIDHLGSLPESDWCTFDLTQSYQQTRQQILADIQPQAIHLDQGDAYVFHRHMLHGMGSWPPKAVDHNAQGRILAYFRPCWHQPQAWLHGP